MNDILSLLGNVKNDTIVQSFIKTYPLNVSNKSILAFDLLVHLETPMLVDVASMELSNNCINDILKICRYQKRYAELNNSISNVIVRLVEKAIEYEKYRRLLKYPEYVHFSEHPLPDCENLTNRCKWDNIVGTFKKMQGGIFRHVDISPRFIEESGVYGFYRKDNTNDPNEVGYIVIDLWFCNDCLSGIGGGYSYTLCEVIAHELAHTLQWNHCKTHSKLTETILNLYIANGGEEL